MMSIIITLIATGLKGSISNKLKLKIKKTISKVQIVISKGREGRSAAKFKAQQSLRNREKIFNNIILIGSCYNACSLAAVVGGCPALGVTVTKTLLGELPQVLLFHWHWGATRHMKNMCILINSHSITKELTCNG